jgi:hypothetical protein
MNFITWIHSSPGKLFKTFIFITPVLLKSVFQSSCHYRLSLYLYWSKKYSLSVEVSISKHISYCEIICNSCLRIPTTSMYIITSTKKGHFENLIVTHLVNREAYPPSTFYRIRRFIKTRKSYPCNRPRRPIGL